MTAEQAMLNLDRVSKSYGADTVLDEVSLKVPKGDTLVLFGPSGAGKTVLLRLVAGAVHPDGGDLYIDGQDMHGVQSEHRNVGMAFQNFALFPHMSAYENIASPLQARGDAKSSVSAAVEAVARLLKIDHVLRQAPAALSNGQKQRTSLARALVGSPRLLLLDDPLRNVDAKLRFEMRLELPRLLREQGTTVVYVTQDYKEAMALGDRIAVLVGGRIQQVGSPEDIYRRPANRDIASLFGDPVINLLDVVPERDEHGIFIRLSGQRFALTAQHDSVLGRPCVFGVRPENIRFAQPGELGSFPAKVEAETPLNEKIVNLVTTERGREILVSRPADSPGPAETDGGSVSLVISDTDWLLFDAETGQRVEVSA